MSLIEIVALSNSMQLITPWIKSTKPKFVPWIALVNTKNL